ncbi:MAG: hypothetical protein GY694_01325, partial [Gammaproteobacteria bacterium]|nr:hypothetical protein [Gammaproteobacteria bacterium]
MNVYIGLGSNLNEPRVQLQTALSHMQSETQIHLLSVSSFYQSVALTLDSMQEGFFYAEG